MKKGRGGRGDVEWMRGGSISGAGAGGLDPGRLMAHGGASISGAGAGDGWRRWPMTGRPDQSE